MSVYSGFATRQMEQHYNHLLRTLIVVLTKRVQKIYTNKPCNEEAFKQILMKVLLNMGLMERHKYMLPKYSEVVLSLVNLLQENTLTLIQNKVPPTQLSQRSQQNPRKILSQIPEQNADIVDSITIPKIVDIHQMPQPPPPPVESFTKLPISPKLMDQSIQQAREQTSQQLPPQSVQSIKENKFIIHQRVIERQPYLEQESPYVSNKFFQSNSGKFHLKSNEPKKRELRPDEIALIEQIIKDYKIKKPKKKKTRKTKKRDAFEKLLMEFEDDNFQEFRDKQNSLNSQSNVNQNIDITNPMSQDSKRPILPLPRNNLIQRSRYYSVNK